MTSASHRGIATDADDAPGNRSDQNSVIDEDSDTPSAVGLLMEPPALTLAATANRLFCRPRAADAQPLPPKVADRRQPSRVNLESESSLKALAMRIALPVLSN